MWDTIGQPVVMMIEGSGKAKSRQESRGLSPLGCGCYLDHQGLRGDALTLWHQGLIPTRPTQERPISIVPVLVSARIELIFFLVAGIVQCFGFSRKTMLITHCWF